MHTPDQLLEKLTDLKRGSLTSRLPKKCSQVNAALIKAVKAKETTSTTLMSVKG